MVTPTPPDWFALVASLLQDGRIDDACRFMQDHVRRMPQDAEARRQLARILLHVGAAADAIEQLRHTVRLQPHAADPLYELGVACLAAEQAEEAEQSFRGALQLRPGLVDAWFNLGWALRRQNRLADAADAYAQALRHDPNSAEAAFNLGNILVDDRRPAEAVAAFEQALRLAPGDPSVLTNLGLACWRSGAADQAERHLRSVLAQYPGHAEACNLLGNLLAAMGQAEEALRFYQAGLGQTPTHPDLLRNLALALRTLNRRTAAAEVLKRLLDLHPRDVDGWNAAGITALERDRLDEAEACLNRAHALAPHHAQVLSNLGQLYAGRGETDRAVDCFRQALDIDPDNAGIHSNYLFYLSHSPCVAKAEVVAAHRRFGEWAERVAPLPPRPAENQGETTEELAGRRLRIGYVSPDFREHAVALWFEPVLKHHDRGAYEITCYHTHPSQDAVTDRFRGYVDRWRPIGHLDPESAARLIRDDRIDILIDLAGHSAHNGLPVFAYKPAPIQGSFLGYPFTTGLTRIDYYLTQTQTDPDQDSDAGYTETLWRLEMSPTLQPPADAPECGSPPTLRTGTIRFGALNRLHKVTPAVITTWAGILKAVPGSTLALILAGGSTAIGRQQVENLFAVHGVSPERLEFHEKMPLRDFLELIKAIDIALDPFPYGGGTTTFLTLWMGVPIVAMVGSGAAAGVSTGMLGAVELGHTLARDPAHYHEIAVALAGRTSELVALRQVLRDRMRQSDIMQHGAFVQALEQAYRQWWQRYVSS